MTDRLTREQAAIRLTQIAWEQLAPGITRGYLDWHYTNALASELTSDWMNARDLDQWTVKVTDSDGLPLVILQDSFGRSRVDCWIEDCHSANAFFYWES